MHVIYACVYVCMYVWISKVILYRIWFSKVILYWIWFSKAISIPPIHSRTKGGKKSLHTVYPQYCAQAVWKKKISILPVHSHFTRAHTFPNLCLSIKITITAPPPPPPPPRVSRSQPPNSQKSAETIMIFHNQCTKALNFENFCQCHATSTPPRHTAWRDAVMHGVCVCVRARTRVFVYIVYIWPPPSPTFYRPRPRLCARYGGGVTTISMQQAKMLKNRNGYL